MAIYDIDGNELSVAYALNGAELAEAYDIDGNPLYEEEEVIRDVDLSKIEPYFAQDVNDTMAYVKNLGTKSWVHHILIADSHYTVNHRKSIPMANALMDTGAFDKLVHLGDLTDATLKNQYQLALTDGIAEHNGDLIFCVGNHDEQVNASSDNYVPWSTETVFYDDLMSNCGSEFTFFDKNKLICTYDDTRRKIRYIILDYSSTYTASSITGFRTWFYNKVGELGSDWAVMFFAHGNFVPASVYQSDSSMPNMFASMLGLANCKILGLISGHMHIDDVKLWKTAFEQVSLINDTSLIQSATGDGTHQYLTKTGGTADENAVTIMSINKASNRVAFRRIGTCYTEAEGKTFEYTVPTGKWLNNVYFGSGGVTLGGADSYIWLYRCPVVPNGVYKFTNTNSAWNPSWGGICVYRSESANSFIDRYTPSFANGGFTFTAPANAKYALFSFTKGSEGEMLDTVKFEVVSEP